MSSLAALNVSRKSLETHLLSTFEQRKGGMMAAFNVSVLHHYKQDGVRITISHIL